MLLMIYRVLVFDKLSGEIFADYTSKNMDLHQMRLFMPTVLPPYERILDKNPFARLNIIPLGDGSSQTDLFNQK